MYYLKIRFEIGLKEYAHIQFTPFKIQKKIEIITTGCKKYQFTVCAGHRTFMCENGYVLAHLVFSFTNFKFSSY